MVSTAESAQQEAAQISPGACEARLDCPITLHPPSVQVQYCTILYNRLRARCPYHISVPPLFPCGTPKAVRPIVSSTWPLCLPLATPVPRTCSRFVWSAGIVFCILP